MSCKGIVELIALVRPTLKPYSDWPINLPCLEYWIASEDYLGEDIHYFRYNGVSCHSVDETAGVVALSRAPQEGPSQ